MKLEFRLRQAVALAIFVFIYGISSPSWASPEVPPADQVADFAIRVRVVEAGNLPPADTDEFMLELGDAAAVAFSGTNWSDWAHSTREYIKAALESYPNSYNRRWEVRMISRVRPRTGRFTGLRLEVETRLDGGAARRTPAELTGASLGLLYWRDSDGEHQLDTLAGHGRRVFDAAARAAVLPPEDRPRQIVFGERYIGGDNDALAWREGIERLCGLGFNAMHAVPRDYVSTVREGGITQLWGAVYSPPGYAFNFSGNRERVFLEFASNQVHGALNAGWQRDEIVLWVTSDEPGWYYPSTYNRFNKNPEAMRMFHEYLREHNQRPRDLGYSNWDDIRLIGRSDYDDLPSRRLFYWSNRFLPWASSRFFAEVTEAYERILGEGFPIMVNFNNFIGRLYQPGPVGNNPDPQDANAAMGQHDWMEFGRLRGSTCIATEDWFADASASQWSFYATRLRSAAALTDAGFGALVIPRTSGQRPEGMAQKLLALVGQGAKHIKFFTYGPEYNFPRNCYAHNTGVYQPLALGMGIVGRAETLLYPGRMRRPAVALLMPQSAQLWDLEEQEHASGLLDVTNTDMFRSHMAYMSELFGLHLALQHAAIPVHAIDEPACNPRDLAAYQVIYLTAPDLPEEAAAALVRWVQRGGTLVMTAGSGLHDRYRQPMNRLVNAAGARPEQAVRPLLRNLNAIPAGPLLKHGETQTRLYGEYETLTLSRRTVVKAEFEDGSPAITERSLGRGRILRFAGFPGISYRRSATQNINGVPAGFNDTWRDLIAKPVHQAGLIQPVRLDRPLIEAPALYSEQGVAVTLLNWSGSSLQAVDIEVDTDRKPARVVSARQGKLPLVFQANDGPNGGYTVTVSLDLGEVDVLSIFH